YRHPSRIHSDWHAHGIAHGIGRSGSLEYDPSSSCESVYRQEKCEGHYPYACCCFANIVFQKMYVHKKSGSAAEKPIKIIPSTSTAKSRNQKYSPRRLY